MHLKHLINQHLGKLTSFLPSIHCIRNSIKNAHVLFKTCPVPKAHLHQSPIPENQLRNTLETAGRI